MLTTLLFLLCKRVKLTTWAFVLVADARVAVSLQEGLMSGLLVVC